MRGTESFSRGDLDNVALENGALVLDETAGQHVLYGCYTGPELAMPAFSSLNVSWNADTPHGTVVEAQCRVFTANGWCGWKSFGKWSPEYPRKSQRGGGDDAVYIMGDTVTVGVAGGASAVQLRMYLYTDSGRETPSVRLLSAAVRPLAGESTAGQPVNRTLYLPEYAAESHDGHFGKSMDLPLTLTALMNRYGADLLPEEIAYAMSDGTTGGCHNAAYGAAAAGACGFECYQQWMDIKALRAEVRAGNSLAVEITRGPAGAGSQTAWLGLHGFGHEESVLADYVLVNDPACAPGSVARTVALTDFERTFTGRALVLHLRPHAGAGCLPQRVCCAMRPGAEPGEYTFESRGEPWPLSPESSGWLACALHDGTAYATTAHRSFEPLARSTGGGILLPEALRTPGARYTVYAVDETGAMRVAELQLPGEIRTEPATAQMKGDLV